MLINTVKGNVAKFCFPDYRDLFLLYFLLPSVFQCFRVMYGTV